MFRDLGPDDLFPLTFSVLWAFQDNFGCDLKWQIMQREETFIIFLFQVEVVAEMNAWELQDTFAQISVSNISLVKAVNSPANCQQAERVTHY